MRKGEGYGERGQTCEDGWWIDMTIVLFSLVANCVLRRSNNISALVLSRPEVGS